MLEPSTLSPAELAELEADKETRKIRRDRRKARERAGEISELNITAMMDMMTIILVFLIKSFTASSTTVQLTEDLNLPKSTIDTQPQETVNITVSYSELAVNDIKVLHLEKGLVPNGKSAASPLIEPLLHQLKKEVEKQKYIANFNPQAPFTGKLNLISDKRVPYRTILAVLYTAGQAELSQYKLMALKAGI